MFINNQVNRSGPSGTGGSAFGPPPRPVRKLLVPGLLYVAGRQRFINGMNRRTDDADNGPSAVLYSAGEGVTGQRYTLRLAGARGKMEKIIEF